MIISLLWYFAGVTSWTPGQVDSVRVVAAVLSSVIGVSGMLFLVAAKAQGEPLV